MVLPWIVMGTLPFGPSRFLVYWSAFTDIVGTDDRGAVGLGNSLLYGVDHHILRAAQRYRCIAQLAQQFEQDIALYAARIARAFYVARAEEGHGPAREIGKRA